MPTATLKKRSTPAPQKIKPATEIISDYEQWLLTHYGSIGTYRDHAKSFLKKFRDKGSVSSQLDTFAAKKSITGRSILNRFRKFLEEKKISLVKNDLKESRESQLPRSTMIVKLYMVTSLDRLKSKKTLSTYATILNDYLKSIGELRHFEKLTAEQFIFRKGLSPFTSALYTSVLKSFAQWAIGFLISPENELSPSERKIKEALSVMSTKSVRDVLAIKTKQVAKKLYYKESLTKLQRNKLMKICAGSEEKAIVALMAYNGLRPVEVERMHVADINFRKFTLAIHGKGRDARHKEIIVLFKIVAKTLRSYLSENKVKKGKVFPHLSYKQLHETTQRLFKEMRLPLKGDIHFSPHSLRHTAGQLLYDSKVPLEFIQRTLRHNSLDSTLVYAQKAIERMYFKKMRHHW